MQPALDAHDPDEENAELGESTLNGDSLVRQQARQIQQAHEQQQQQQQPQSQPHDSSDRPLSRPNGTSMFPADSPSDPKPHDSHRASTVEQPRPISPSSNSSNSSSIERLERKAARMSQSEGDADADDRAQAAIKQHISTDLKSLFRLARSAGMERREFERVVKSQVECLGFLEENE